MPMAMTAHVIYSAVDRKRPATTSKKVIKAGDPRGDRVRRAG
jgi:beta-glucosidase-like glycosyl hydrolase